MQEIIKLTQAEEKLTDLLWEKAPIASMELIKVAECALGWKKSTTFSVLKRVIEKGAAKNENSVVEMICTKEQYISVQSRRYVEDAFGGSLPKFIASFFGGKSLSAEQADELRRFIDDYDGGGGRD